MGVQKPRDSGSRFCYYKVSLSWRLCQTAAIIIWQTSPQHAHAATRCKPTTRPAFAFVASHKTRTTTICPFLIGLIRLLNGGAHTVCRIFVVLGNKMNHGQELVSRRNSKSAAILVQISKFCEFQGLLWNSKIMQGARKWPHSNTVWRIFVVLGKK